MKSYYNVAACFVWNSLCDLPNRERRDVGSAIGDELQRLRVACAVHVIVEMVGIEMSALK